MGTTAPSLSDINSALKELYSEVYYGPDGRWYKDYEEWHTYAPAIERAMYEKQEQKGVDKENE